MSRYWRKKTPNGAEVSEEYANGMNAMESWYHDFVVWAYAYISLLEKRLSQRCSQCQYDHNERSSNHETPVHTDGQDF